MTVIYVSPTEPKRLRDIGVTDLLPEEYGADILWKLERDGEEELYGIQRKEFPGDFIASLHEGRLGEQLAKMEQLTYGALILEGRQGWSVEGKLLATRWAYNRTQHRKLLASIQTRGIHVFSSDGVHDTREVVEALVQWSKKEGHTSLDRTRNGAEKDQWGRVTNRTWQLHFLQGLPGIGPIQASAIVDALGVPFKLTATYEDLISVDGIGKGRALKIMRVFDE